MIHVVSGSFDQELAYMSRRSLNFRFSCFRSLRTKIRTDYLDLKYVKHTLN